MRLTCVWFNKAGAARHPETPMNKIFKDLLSLHGYPLPFESIERVTGEVETPDYANGYGNRIASERAFPRLGRAHGRVAAVRHDSRDVCVTGGCA